MTSSVKSNSDSETTKRLAALRVQLMTGGKTDVFGQRIRQRRRELNLTQDALAEMLGVQKARISEWERGIHRPGSHELMEAIADALKKPVAWFFAQDHDPPDLMAALSRPPEWARRLDAQLRALLRAQGLDPDEIVADLPPPPEDLLP